MQLTKLDFAQARQKARAAARRMRLDADDLFQEGCLAMLEASKDFQSEEHRVRYLGKRCFGAMIDYARLEQRRTSIFMDVHRDLESVTTDDDPHQDSLDHSEPCSASFGIVLSQLRDRLGREGESYVTVFDALLNGDDPADIAATLGVSTVRVSQLRARIKELSGRYV